ncbi:MAG: hypothetical protein DRJ67_10165, partial [Thermoprotei archaeon]
RQLRPIGGAQARGAGRSWVSASVRLEVWKDKRAWLDSRYAYVAATITLNRGERIALKIAFRPDEASGLILRGYYLKLLVNGEEVWVMKNSYPPRLKVRE